MKKIIISLLVLLFLCVNVFAAPSTYFVDGHSGKGAIVKVEETTTTTLKSGDIGYTDVVDMQNKIVSLITNYSIYEVNAYILDFGSEILNYFSDAPHVGDVVTSGNVKF